MHNWCGRADFIVCEFMSSSKYSASGSRSGKKTTSNSRQFLSGSSNIVAPITAVQVFLLLASGIMAFFV